MWRIRVAALSTGQNGLRLNFIAKLHRRYEAIPTSTVDFFGIVIISGAIGSQCPPSTTGKTNGNAGFGIIKRLTDITI